MATSKSSNMLELLQCTRDYIHQHGAAGRPFDVFRALTSLSLKQAEENRDLKISSMALQAEIDGGMLIDKSPGSTLAGPWKTLTERLLPAREQGLQQFFAQHGYDSFLWPMKVKSSGGAGNPSMYYLETRPISMSQELDPADDRDVENIRYIPEFTPRPAWWLKKIFEGGYALEGWRRWLLIGVGLFNLMVVVIVLILTYLIFAYSGNLTFQTGLTWIFSSALISWIAYSGLSPLVNLLDWRVIKAPELLVSLKENNVLLEIVNEPQASGDRKRIIRLARYAGTCPICLAKVEVVEGKREFPNRFIGRCQESPAEHVYSFDRITLNGKLLR